MMPRSAYIINPKVSRVARVKTRLVLPTGLAVFCILATSAASPCRSRQWYMVGADMMRMQRFLRSEAHRHSV